jgi:hypothetical protein
MIDEFRGQYSFLSNFYPCRIAMDDDIIYPSAEHAYQAQKITPQMYPDTWRKRRLDLANYPSPGRAKRLGRAQKLTLTWNVDRLLIMEEIVRRKFVQNKDLAEKLMSTGRRTLIEGNWWKDVFWGVYQGEGENHLGRILMKIRSELDGGR